MKTEKRISRREQICEDLISRIRNEEWTHGARLPSLDAMCKEYKVSMITIIGAVRMAEEKGFIETRQGSGTYVKWRSEDVFFPFAKRNGRKIEVTHTLLSPTPLARFVAQQLAECFMKVYTDIRIRFQEIQISRDREDPYIQRIANGDMPCSGEFYWHAIYARLDALLPLEELPGFESLQAALLPQALYRTRNAAGELRCHAIYQNLGLPAHVLVNRQWMNAIGVSLPEKIFNWSQLFRMLRHSGDRNAPAGMYAGALQVPHEWHGVKCYLELMGQGVLGGNYDFTSSDTMERIVCSESALNALENLQEFLSIRPGAILLGKPNENFAIGRVGILPYAASWTHHLLSTMNAEWETVAGTLPAIAPETACHSFYSGFSIGIFRDGIRSREQLTATWNWIKFLLSRQAQELGSQSMTLTVRRDATPYIAEVNPKICDLANRILQKAVPQPDFVGMRRVFSDISPTLATFLHGELTAAQCLEKLRKAVRRRNLCPR